MYSVENAITSLDAYLAPVDREIGFSIFPIIHLIIDIFLLFSVRPLFFFFFFLCFFFFFLICNDFVNKDFQGKIVSIVRSSHAHCAVNCALCARCEPGISGAERI